MRALIMGNVIKSPKSNKNNAKKETAQNANQQMQKKKAEISIDSLDSEGDLVTINAQTTTVIETESDSEDNEDINQSNRRMHTESETVNNGATQLESEPHLTQITSVPNNDDNEMDNTTITSKHKDTYLSNDQTEDIGRDEQEALLSQKDDVVNVESRDKDQDDNVDEQKRIVDSSASHCDATQDVTQSEIAIELETSSNRSGNLLNVP